MKQLREYLIQKVSQPFALNKFFFCFCILSIFATPYIANYEATVNQAWNRFNYLVYFHYYLLVFSLRKEIIFLVGLFLYKVIFYLILNCLIDRYIGIEGWSWNDKITVILIGIEAIIATLKNKKNARRYSSLFKQS